MSTQTIFNHPTLQAYWLAKSLREPAILAELRLATAALPAANMQLAPAQAQLLALLVELIGARKTLELGVFTGYSTLATALALPGDGQIIACDIDSRHATIAQTFWRKAEVAHKIDLRIAPALNTLTTLRAQGAGGTFDFALIDADKANYLAYYEHCLALLRPGGLIAVDNVLWRGEVAVPSNQHKITRAMRTFNDFIHRDERISLSILPMGDGLTLARKR